MSSVAFPAASLPQGWTWPFGRKIADWTLGFIVFLGAFVIEEPAPYEILLCPIILVWIVFGLRLNRYFLPLTVLLILYVAGGCLSLTQMDDPASQMLYIATSAFLALSSIFFAAVITEAPERRMRIITRAHIASAVIASLLGIAAYFNLIPDAALFIRYERVKATFQDPNVFGPFLVLPIVLLVQGVLIARFRNSWGKAILLAILLAAEFFAFSRAAWGMTILAVLLIAFFTYINEARQTTRLRIVIYVLAGFLLAGLLITVALSFPAISDLFAQRAYLVEDYDAGRLGRFGRHVLGFYLVQEHPLGIGPLVFAKLLGEDEHNMWLKGFTTYGWLGGFSYIALVVWTLAASTPLLFKPRPWRGIVQCVYVVFIGQLMIHNVIDNDHWRHLFLIYGMLWGAVAAEKMYMRAVRQSGLVPIGDARPMAPALMIR